MQTIWFYGRKQATKRSEFQMLYLSFVRNLKLSFSLFSIVLIQHFSNSIQNEWIAFYKVLESNNNEFLYSPNNQIPLLFEFNEHIQYACNEFIERIELSFSVFSIEYFCISIMFIKLVFEVLNYACSIKSILKLNFHI